MFLAIKRTIRFSDTVREAFKDINVESGVLVTVLVLAPHRLDKLFEDILGR